jgi:hypothetical protein
MLCCENFTKFRKIGTNIKLQIKEIREPDLVFMAGVKRREPKQIQLKTNGLYDEVLQPGLDAKSLKVGWMLRVIRCMHTIRKKKLFILSASGSY